MKPRARRTDPRTSHDAAKSMVRSATQQQKRIEKSLLLDGRATADDLDVKLFNGRHTAGRRLCEMKGIAKRTKKIKRTRSGRMAHIWKLKYE